MKRFLITLLIISLANVVNAKDNHHPHYDSGDQNWFPGGIAIGGWASRICTQTADDTTPSMGFGTLVGCNVLLTSLSHSGLVTVTALDDVGSGTDAWGAYEQPIWIIGRSATNRTQITDGGNFVLKTITWDSAATGDHSVLELETVYMTGAITSIANAGPGQVTVTSNGHLLQEDQTVVHTGCTDAAYNGTFTATNVLANTYEITAVWTATDTGTWVSIRFDETSRSGNVDDYFYQNVYVNQGNATDFPAAQVVVGQADTGKSDANNVGLVAEANAAGALSGTGILGIGKGTGALNSYGVKGVGHITVTGDTTTAVGVSGESKDVHAGGSNVAFWADAQLGGNNYALYIAAGHFFNAARMDWTLLDNSATSLTLSSTGAASIFNISTADGEETVSHTSKFTGTSALDAASGDEYAWDLAYTTNKLTSGDDYGLRIRMTDTASPATSYLIDVGVASSQWNVTNTGIMTLYGSAWTDALQMYHDETDVYFRTLDGNFIFQTDEGTNTATVMEIKPKGTSEVSSVGLYDTDTQELYAYTAANRGFIQSGTGSLGLQNAVVQDVLLWEAIASGNPSLILSGWNTAGSDLESTELTMDDANDEFLIRAANSANHEGITVELDEANQLFRVRGSDGAVDFSSSDTAVLVVNPATFNSTIDAESYMAIGNGSALAANHTLIIDRDFSTATLGSQLSVLGLMTITGGTSSSSAAVFDPEGITINDGGPNIHPLLGTVEFREPNILETQGTVTDAYTVRILDAPTEGDNNYAFWVVSGATLLGGGLALGDDLDLNWNDILDVDEMYGQAPTSDVAPSDTDWLIANAYARATGGSQTGASANVRTGIGSRFVLFNDFANSAGDTWRGEIDGVGTPTYDLVADTDFVCSTAADDAECALNYMTAFNGKGWPVTASCTDGTCTTATVYLQPDDNGIFSLAHSIVDAGGGAMGVVTSGTDGSWSVHTVHNALVVDGDGDTTFGGNLTIPATGTIQATGLSKLAFPADGHMQLLIAAGTAGALFDADTAGTLLLKRHDGTDDLDVTIGGTLKASGVDLSGGNLYPNQSDVNTYLTTASTDRFDFNTGGTTFSIYESSNLIYLDNISSINGLWGNISQYEAISDSGDGNPATLTLTPTSTSIRLNCQDADGCAITMDTPSNLFDNFVVIRNQGTNDCTFADAAGTHGLYGDVTLGLNSVLSLIGSTVGVWFEESSTHTSLTPLDLNGDDIRDSSDNIVGIVGALTAGSVASDTFVTGTYGTFSLGAAEKFYINATSTKQTQTAGALDIDVFLADGATGVVGTDISMTSPAAGLGGGESLYGWSIGIAGDANDNATSARIAINLGYTPNGAGGDTYGVYNNDTDFTYGIYNVAPTHLATVAVTGGGTKGALTSILTKEESVTFANDAAKTTTTTMRIPGARIKYVTGRVTTLLAGCTSVDVGDGVDQDLYAATVALAQNTTFDGSDVTSHWGNPHLTSAPNDEVTVTANGGNCTAGVVAITVHYTLGTAATSN